MPLGAAPTLPDQLALPRSVSLLPSDTTMLENVADRASPSLALPETFILMVTTPPLELDVPYTLNMLLLTMMLHPLTEQL